MADNVNQNNKDVNLTYETLFELLRREKNRVELQTLEPSFYKDFIEYLKTKKQILQDKQSKLSLDQTDGITQFMIQIDNINKIMKELYERREKKIVSSALLNVRSGKGLSNEVMLELESRFYTELMALFSKYRKGILINILNQKMPLIEDNNSNTNTSSTINNLATDNIKDNLKSSKEHILVRFLAYVPKFVGEELETYGPFEMESITTIPSKIAKILIDNNKAEEIKEE
ncbi:MAG: hypothetical protein ABIG89_04135 [Candidatus Woesearchaeota archaeon]